MDPFWPLLIVFTVGLVLSGVLAFGSRLFRGTRVYHRSFWCPYRGRNVEVDFVEAAWDGHPRDVAACSLFVPMTRVVCDKACLRLGRFAPKR